MMLTLLEASAGHHLLTPIWFILISVLWTGFFFLEGFDFGVAMLLPIMGRSDRRKRAMVNTIGPVWDGNEVWLLTAGGAMFAAFPGWYATLFSGLYLPLLLVLLGLIIRGVAFEYRSKHPDSTWRNTFDWMATIGSFLPSLVLGVGFANFVKGIPVGGNPPLVTASFWSLFSPFALLGGVLFVVLFCAHGAIFLALKTRGELHEDAKALGSKLALVAGALLLVFGIWMNIAYGKSNAMMHTLTWILMTLAGLSVLAAGYLVGKGKDSVAFLSTGVGIMAMIVSFFLTMYGNLGFISSGQPGLDMWSASSSPYTLKIMTVAAAIFVPVVLGYQIWTYWVFRRRISVDNMPDDMAAEPAAATA